MAPRSVATMTHNPAIFASDDRAAVAPDVSGQTLYDKIPYESRPYPRAHVDRLACVAALMGMSPAPLENCRVLEIGCAAGGHLIPMAMGFPGSRFIGVDISTRELEEGRQLIASLGLENIELIQRGAEAIDDAMGRV